MSRGAVRARANARRLERELKREAAKLDDWYRRAVAGERLDAVLAACDGCGLVQVAPGPPCPVCGGETGAFLEFLPGHAGLADLEGRAAGGG